MIEDLRQRKPIKVILNGTDMGIYKFNTEKQRYEGFGYLTLDTIKRILQEQLNFIEIEGVDESE